MFFCDKVVSVPVIPSKKNENCFDVLELKTAKIYVLGISVRKLLIRL